MKTGLLTLAALCAAPAFAASCESLASLELPDTTITLAQSVAAGAFVPPAAPAKGKGKQNATTFRDLPAFCRVTATIKPTSDSDIRIEVWMPATGWNGKLEGNGNGGWTGSINPATLATGLRRGYATAMTDTGHEGGSGSFALGHPQKLIDFGYRSTHEMTLKAKAIIATLYDRAPKYSYFSGCSAGGKQGLKEAQKFPADYDGIISGSPGNNWTNMMVQIVWVAQAVHKDNASNIPAAKYRLLHDAAVAKCDLSDGAKDGVIGIPPSCKFDPGALQCSGADGPSCLTKPQVDAARKIYSDVINPRTKKLIYPGFEPGSELGWGQFVAGATPTTFATDLFKYVVFKNENWDYKTLNFDSDVALAEKIDNGVNNANDPNLSQFFRRGGKLIQYHGWNDQLIAPGNSVNYYNSVVDELGKSAVEKSYRLYMIPGMSHCQGGEGADTFDSLGALEQWVEQGKPKDVVASRVVAGKVERTRPLCPYPQVAKYKGSGDANDAANFACKMP
jgi:Tannase and feruloyl esterase